VSNNGISTITRKLKACSTALSTWSRKKYDKVESTLRRLMAQLVALQGMESKQNMEEIKGVKGEIEKILEQEDISWRQCAKVNWYKQGDRNTSFFHVWANHRLCTNRIEKIQDAFGVQCTSQEDVYIAFLHYFQVLFTSGGSANVEGCLSELQPCVSEEMNQSLTKEFTALEV
jgi:hypothetical protein